MKSFDPLFLSDINNDWKTNCSSAQECLHLTHHNKAAFSLPFHPPSSPMNYFCLHINGVQRMGSHENCTPPQ